MVSETGVGGERILEKKKRKYNQNIYRFNISGIVKHTQSDLVLKAGYVTKTSFPSLSAFEI